MYTFTLLFAFCFTGIFAGLIEQNDARLKSNNECLVEYGIDPAYNADINPPLTEEQIYCVVACTYRDYGIMRSDGTINEEKAASFFGNGDVEEKNIFFSVYNACKDGKVGCKLAKCMFGELKHHIGSSSDSNTITRRLLSSKGFPLYA